MLKELQKLKISEDKKRSQPENVQNMLENIQRWRKNPKMLKNK